MTDPINEEGGIIMMNTTKVNTKVNSKKLAKVIAQMAKPLTNPTPYIAVASTAKETKQLYKWLAEHNAKVIVSTFQIAEDTGRPHDEIVREVYDYGVEYIEMDGIFDQMFFEPRVYLDDEDNLKIAYDISKAGCRLLSFELEDPEMKAYYKARVQRFLMLNGEEDIAPPPEGYEESGIEGEAFDRKRGRFIKYNIAR